MDMDQAIEREAVCGLVVDACALVERAALTMVADDALAVAAVLLRDELTARLQDLTDPELAADAALAADELDALLVRLDRLPARVAALTG